MQRCSLCASCSMQDTRTADAEFRHLVATCAHVHGTRVVHTCVQQNLFWLFLVLHRMFCFGLDMNQRIHVWVCVSYEFRPNEFPYWKIENSSSYWDNPNHVLAKLGLYLDSYYIIGRKDQINYIVNGCFCHSPIFQS